MEMVGAEICLFGQRPKRERGACLFHHAAGSFDFVSGVIMSTARRLATLAGAKSCLFGLFRCCEEADVFSFGAACRTGGAAIDAGCRDSIEEVAVIAAVPLKHGCPLLTVDCLLAPAYFELLCHRGRG